jgi:hypothetical protein
VVVAVFPPVYQDVAGLCSVVVAYEECRLGWGR